ncbi:MAG: low temperature requirement protein A [Steroidobacteraceae bacterium]
MSAPATAQDAHPLLRRRDGASAHVTSEELFFDLVYAFALTQLSHLLWHHLTAPGVAQALILWFAVWLGWQYTCWVTNWFDPQTPAIRTLLVASMALALVMASSIPQAFAERGWLFALAYVAMQVGRSAYVVARLPAGHPLAANYRRILVWVLIAAIFWVAGGLAAPRLRLLLWLVAVLCEYLSPMFGFALPGLGRSRTSEWTIEGAHLAERCQQFVIVALGESLLATGAALARAGIPSVGESLAALLAFLGTLAMWWLYFGTSSRDARAAIVQSHDPGRMGANFHYIHVILIAAIIAAAVGGEVVLARPFGAPAGVQAAALAAGPSLYLLGSAIYKRVVYGVIPLSHVLAAGVLVLLAPAAGQVNLISLAALGTAVLLVVSYWETRMGRCPAAPVPAVRSGH